MRHSGQALRRLADRPGIIGPFAFAGRGKLLTLPFAMLSERARKSRGPPLLAPSFKVQRNTAHNQSSGFAVAPGLKGLNARGPLKVHPKLHFQGWAFAASRGISAGAPCAGADRPAHNSPQKPDSPAGFLDSWGGHPGHQPPKVSTYAEPVTPPCSYG